VLNYSTDTLIPIQVYFRFPDSEIVGNRSFPHMAIDLIEINFDPTRAQRGFQYSFTYATEQATPPIGFSQTAYDYPLPFNLVYQIACYSEQPRHDRQMAGMLYTLFPEGYGFLDMSNYDGTIRRADFVSAVRRDIVDPSSKKRRYRNIVTISVSSEFLLGQVYEIQHVSNAPVINLDLYLNEPAVIPS
jgi:hypothetical protein